MNYSFKLNILVLSNEIQMSQTKTRSKREPADTLYSLLFWFNHSCYSVKLNSSCCSIVSFTHYDTSTAALDLHWLWHILDHNPPTRALAPGWLSLLLTSTKLHGYLWVFLYGVSHHTDRQTQSGKQTDWQTCHLPVGFLDLPNTVFFDIVPCSCKFWMEEGM